MNKFEHYKRLIKFSFSFIIVLAEVIGYGIIWNFYYNKILEFPFWRKGNWLMIALYAILLIFFIHTYGGFKIEYLKTENLICSHLLSIIWVNAITYIQISLLDKKIHSLKLILILSCIDILIFLIWMFLFQHIYQHIFPPKKVLLVYGKLSTSNIVEKINSRHDKYRIVKAVCINEINMEHLELKQYDAVIADDIPVEQRNKLMKQSFEQSVRLYAVPKLSDILIRSATELDIFDMPLLLSRNDGLQIEQKWIKRLIDIVVSATGLILLSPLFLVIAVCVKMTDKGPIFYTQNRLTFNEKEFRLYKFRTMIQDAEKRTGPQLAAMHDERILPIGKVLRRSRLDELPQLWNVLKGDMSLVGPRPERPELAKEIEKEIPEFGYRLKVKAGLTGYAQVYGKYNTTPYDKLKLDLIYIRKYSILLDLKLIMLTPKVMLIKESTEGVRQKNDSKHHTSASEK